MNWVRPYTGSNSPFVASISSRSTSMTSSRLQQGPRWRSASQDSGFRRDKIRAQLMDSTNPTTWTHSALILESRHGLQSPGCTAASNLPLKCRKVTAHTVPGASLLQEFQLYKLIAKCSAAPRPALRSARTQQVKDTKNGVDLEGLATLYAL